MAFNPFQTGFMPTHGPNRRQRREHLQRPSTCRKPSRSHRLQVVSIDGKRFKHIRHKQA